MKQKKVAHVKDVQIEPRNAVIYLWATVIWPILMLSLVVSNAFGVSPQANQNSFPKNSTEVDGALKLRSIRNSQQTKILDFQGSVRYRREHDTFFFRANKKDILNIGDRVVTGAESWVILETQTANGRTAASIGPNQLFTVDSKMLPSTHATMRKQPNSDDVLTATMNSKKNKGGASQAPLSGFFDLNSIPDIPKEAPDPSAEGGQKIEGTRFMVEMKDLAVFFPLGSVFVVTKENKWEFTISLKSALNSASYLMIDSLPPAFKRIENRFLEVGTQEIPFGGLPPGEYQWQILSADSSKRSRLGSVYVESLKPGLFPLPNRALPGDTILYY